MTKLSRHLSLPELDRIPDKQEPLSPLTTRRFSYDESSIPTLPYSLYLTIWDKNQKYDSPSLVKEPQVIHNLGDLRLLFMGITAQKKTPNPNGLGVFENVRNLNVLRIVEHDEHL
jgi:hypothetical protein